MDEEMSESEASTDSWSQVVNGVRAGEAGSALLKYVFTCPN